MHLSEMPRPETCGEDECPQPLSPALTASDAASFPPTRHCRHQTLCRCVPDSRAFPAGGCFSSQELRWCHYWLPCMLMPTQSAAACCGRTHSPWFPGAHQTYRRRAPAFQRPAAAYSRPEPEPKRKKTGHELRQGTVPARESPRASRSWLLTAAPAVLFSMPAVSEHPQMAAGRARAGLPSRRVRGERQKFYAAGFGFDCGSWSPWARRGGRGRGSSR